MKSKLLLILSLCVISLTSVAQETTNDRIDRKVIQKISPQGMDNYFFGVFYYNGKDVYNVRGYKVCSGDSIDDLKINPSYTSFATLEHNKKGVKHVTIYDATVANKVIKTIKRKDANTEALAYAHDAKQLAISFSDKSIQIYNPITNEAIKTFESKIVPTKLQYSDNNYFLVASDKKSVEIWNLERGAIRKTLTFDNNVNDLTFTNGSANMLVLTSDGKLNIYDTKTFNVQTTIDDLGEAIACYPNQDSKYVTVLNSSNRYSIVNTLDPTERHITTDPVGGISNIRMVKNAVDDETYTIFNDANSIFYHRVDGLTPYYNKMMTTMLNDHMTQWMKQMPNETLEAYQARVNETTRAAQAKEFERELATRMATGLLEGSEVSIGNYNTNAKSLALHFNSMPDIFLGVPQEDLNSFSDASKLEFRNAKYGLNPDDKFELVYAEVYNPENGKTYVFDNMERQSLAYMAEEENFVPLEIIQKSNMEETALMNIKEEAINVAKQDQVITDKTHISVKTDAVPAVNADGEKIVNYNVDFTYEVEEEFSARDDFKPGHYHTNESKAAMLMLQIMKQAFEKDFAKYMVDGKRVKIKVKGTADASPINRTLAYDGKYGEFTGEPVYKNDELNNITLTKKDGMSDNEQLAFARALGVKNYIEKELTGLSKMNSDFEYHIEVSKEEGSKFRRISVQYTFIDAQF